MNTWTEIKIAVSAKNIDRASDIANVVVPYGIYIEDYTNLEQTVEDIAHIDLIDTGTARMYISTSSPTCRLPRRWRF